uniref:Putative secreted protein n=1 Tax=Anopheles darlingi TaxID=43151 RepID=A0A2M4DGA8_ANODA
MMMRSLGVRKRWRIKVPEFALFLLACQPFLAKTHHPTRHSRQSSPSSSSFLSWFTVQYRSRLNSEEEEGAREFARKCTKYSFCVPRQCFYVSPPLVRASCRPANFKFMIF